MFSIEFLVIAWISGSILGCIGVALSRKNFRIEGLLSWFLLLLLCGAPTAVAVIGVHYLPTPENILMPTTAGFAMVIGAWYIHVLLPRIIPDFTPTSLPSTLLLALFQGVSIVGTYYMMFPDERPPIAL